MAEFELAPGWSFVVKSPALLLGYLFGSKVADEAEIQKIAVISDYRRHGLADILLNTAFSYLAAQGAALCFLELRQGNRAAIRLYQRYQFTRIGIRKNYYTSPRDNAILLRKGIHGALTFVDRVRVSFPLASSKPRLRQIMKNIKDINVSGQKVLVRVDFNVPFDENGAISDDTRICGVLPTIDYLVKRNAKIILCSHCGRPKGERLRKYSLAPMADRLSKLLGREVQLAHDCVGPEVQQLAAALRDSGILLLENLRFHAEEQKNDAAFARQLASLADIYVNDAFAVSHRAHASVEGVTRYMDVCAAGFLLQREIDFFNRSITSPARPLAVVMGGAKVSTKLGAIRNMLDRVDIMIIGGAMANTFLKSQGYEIGKSLVEDQLLDTARELLELARSKGVKFYLPVDCVAAEKFSPQAVTRLSTIQDMPPHWLSLDIGPASSTLFGEALADAGTIVWNGPMGAFEMTPFARGSLAMVYTVTASHALSIAGGGDTNVVIKQAGAAGEISYISTGGGAFLMLMEGKELPGIAALA